MDPNQQKEQFSNAFLHAIAAVSECAVSKPSVDDDSVDWTLSKVMPRRPRLDLQLKCTASLAASTDDGFPYWLKKKNYDDLRMTDLLCPRILVVVLVPEIVAEWITLGPEEISLRRCARWVSLFGSPESANETGVTVYIPENQYFTVEALNNMMQTISNGGQP